MEVHDGTEFCSYGRGGAELEPEQPEIHLQVRASDSSLRRRRIYGSRCRRYAGQDHRLQLRGFSRRSLPKRRRHSSLLRSQGEF